MVPTRLALALFLAATMCNASSQEANGGAADGQSGGRAFSRILLARPSSLASSEPTTSDPTTPSSPLPASPPPTPSPSPNPPPSPPPPPTPSSPLPDNSTACACSPDPPGNPGCGQWDIMTGKTDFWCYVKDPSNCPSSTPSGGFAGAAWVWCGPGQNPSPDVAKTGTGDCACTTDGKSGPAQTFKPGCAQHNLKTLASEDFVCYVKNPTGCPSAQPSQAYPGAFWVTCGPSA